ncbi:MAG: aminoacetone oxidase family FAD-binding enzyme [Campylobacterota bacterium]|nr:aminoacetone oxidase family FAD-binding enzyme [Campylobacterota bacterium]
MKKFDVLILGGGASGLMCAGWLNQNSSYHVGMIEGNSKLAQKLKISGGGKCNITNVNVSEKQFLGNESFVKTVLDHFSKEDLLAYLDKRALKPVLRKSRYYFCPKSSDEIIDILKRDAKKTAMILNEKVLHVKSEENFKVTTDRRKYEAKYLVIATGAESYKSIGASAIGLEIAKDFEHEVKPFHPALVGLTLQPAQFWMKALSGISLHVKIKVGEKELDEELLFAHKGISGPAVLSASLYWHKGDIEINFLPALHPKGTSSLSLTANVRDMCRATKKHISSALPLSKRFIKAFLTAIDLEDKPCNKLNTQELEKLSLIHNYAFAPSGNFGFSKAEVCKGGVKTEMIDSRSMESKEVENLYFIGEVLDVTGELGGYNFQWAFSSGVVCAKDLLQKST